MKVLTILGTRPEIIRLCLVIQKLDKLCDQIIVHTGQNYDYNLDEIFFKELGVRKPDYYLGAKGSFGEQISIILKGIEKVLIKERPDRFLVLGDTNSSLAAIMAKRTGIPVYHMEAGNRCYNEKVPEEVNRKIIDHCSTVLMPYTERSRANLLKEGIEGERIYVTGNPIKEVLDYFEQKIEKSKIFEKFKIKKNNYFLVTLHRSENVDVPERLEKFIDGLNRLTKSYKTTIIFSVHPHTKKRILENKKIKISKDIIMSEPLGLFDFIYLEKNARCVLTDSGTVQEECSIFNVPNVTLRDETERPETIEAGSNILSGAEPNMIVSCVKTVLSSAKKWSPPPEYLVQNVSDKVVKIVLGHQKK